MTSSNNSLTDVSLKHERNDINDQQISKRNYIEIDEDNNELTLLSDDDDDTNYLTNDELIEMNDDGEENSMNGICNDFKSNNNNNNNSNINNYNTNSNHNNNGQNSQNGLSKRRRIHKNSTYFTASQSQINSSDDYTSSEQRIQQSSFYMNEITDSQNSHLNIRLPFIIDFFYIVSSVSANGESIRGKCKHCPYEFSCKIRPTSNFSKHAQLAHEKEYIEYLKIKEKTKIRRGPHINSLSSFIPTSNSNVMPSTSINATASISNSAPSSSSSASTKSLITTPNVSASLTLPTSQPKNPGNIEKKLFKFMIGSLMSSSCINTDYFRNLLDLIDSNSIANSTALITKEKYLDNLMPKYFNECERNAKEFIQRLKDYSIRIDLFSDDAESSQSCLFIGFSVSGVDNNWKPAQHLLGCLKFNKSQLFKQTALILLDLIRSRFIGLMQKFSLKSSSLYKMVITNCNEINLWQQFREWPLNGLEMLNESFFFSSKFDQTNENFLLQHNFNQNELNIYDEVREEKGVGVEETDQECLTLGNLNKTNHPEALTSVKTESTELSKLIDQIVRIDLNGSNGENTLPSIADWLNVTVRECLESLFAETNNKSVLFLEKTLKKIGRSFCSFATTGQRKSKLLIKNIMKIRDSVYSHKMMPRWCQQLVLLKQMFNIDLNQLTKRLEENSDNLFNDETNELEYEMWLKQLSSTEKFYIKEFVKLLDPVHFMLVELIEEDTMSKVLPCFRTVLSTYQQCQFNISFLIESKSKIEKSLTARLQILNKDSSFSLAAVLDCRFGTSWAPPFEKIKLENMLIEQITLSEETNLNKKSSDLNPMHSYIFYDETCLQERQEHLNVYKNEVKDYLASIRSADYNLQAQSDPLVFWSVNCQKWPCLARLARKVFSVPPVKYSVECSLQLDKQQSLSNHNDFKHLEQILFLKCNDSLY